MWTRDHHGQHRPDLRRRDHHRPDLHGRQTAVDLTLPVATGGNGAITYNLLTASSIAITDLSTVIPGLTLDAAARTIHRRAHRGQHVAELRLDGTRRG